MMQNNVKRIPEPYPWPKFSKLWDNEELDEEQAIAQLIVWGELLHDALLECQRRIEMQDGHIADLAAQVAESKGGDANKP